MIIRRWPFRVLLARCDWSLKPYVTHEPSWRASYLHTRASQLYVTPNRSATDWIDSALTIVDVDITCRWSLTANNRRRKDFFRIPLADQRLLPDYPQKLNEVDDRIRRNADVLDEIVFRAEDAGIGPSPPNQPLPPTGDFREEKRGECLQSFMTFISMIEIHSCRLSRQLDW